MGFLQALLQQAGARLLTAGDSGTALRLIAMLRGAAAAFEQVGAGLGAWHLPSRDRGF